MRCRECGLEVDNEKAFCPVCGAPMKMTADYDYIQAEIANKVDRFFNDEAEEKKKDSDSDSKETGSNPEKSNDDLLEEIIDSESKTKPEQISSKKANRKKNSGNPRKNDNDDMDELAKTRNIYGNDSIYAEDEYSDRNYDEYDENEVYPDNGSPKKKKDDYREKHPVKEQKKRKNRPEPDDYYYQPKEQTAAKIITVLIIFVIIAACAIGVMAITGVFGNNVGSSSSVVTSGSSLTSSITPGETYQSPVEISLSSSTGETIYYTVDGSEPTTESNKYTGPFTVSASDVPRTYPTVNLRAAAYGNDSEKCGDLNITFEFEYDESMTQATEAETETQTQLTSLEDPQIVPESGSYSSDINITVYSPDGADIYYTYDGTIPTSASQKYTGSVKMIPGSSVFSAICIKDGIQSNVVSVSYELDYGYSVSADDAIWNVKDTLIWQGIIADYDGNTYEGGYADIKHLGVYTIGDYTYYIVETDVFDSTGNIENTYFYGVGVNYGGVSTAERDGDSFVVY